MRSLRLGIVGGFLALSASCTELAVLDAGTVVTTDKSTVDHAVSFFSGKNCSTVRLEAGRTYCVEDELNPTPAVHCYRTLGEVTCYSRRDPFRNGRGEVGVNDQNFTTPR